MGKKTGASDSKLDSNRFGSVAFLLGYVTLEQLQQALAVQVEDNVFGRKHRLLGAILREKNWITEEQEKAILAEKDTIGR